MLAKYESYHEAAVHNLLCFTGGSNLNADMLVSTFRNLSEHFIVDKKKNFKGLLKTTFVL